MVRENIEMLETSSEVHMRQRLLTPESLNALFLKNNLGFVPPQTHFSVVFFLILYFLACHSVIERGENFHVHLRF